MHRRSTKRIPLRRQVSANVEPYIALAPLKAAIERYSQSPAHLTSIHYIFIERCLISRCYDEALPILDTPIYDLDLQVLPFTGIRLMTQTSLETIHYLQYFYYGCLVYIALKDYEKAMDFAKLVTSMQTSSLRLGHNSAGCCCFRGPNRSFQSLHPPLRNPNRESVSPHSPPVPNSN